MKVFCLPSWLPYVTRFDFVEHFYSKPCLLKCDIFTCFAGSCHAINSEYIYKHKKYLTNVDIVDIKIYFKGVFFLLAPQRNEIIIKIHMRLHLFNKTSKAL